MKILIPLILITFTATSAHAQDARKGPYADLIKGEFVHAEKPLAEGGLPLWLFADRKLASGKKKYPLLICLHGRRNNAKPDEKFKPQNIATPWTKKDSQRDNPCFVVQPYYPPKGGWEKIPEKLDATIAHLIENLPVDPERVYLLGFSNGAQGTFQTLARQPDVYAAAITISGPVDPKSVVGKIEAPIRAWVGENDNDSNKNGRSIALAKALKDDGLDIEMTVVKGAGHSCHHVPTGDPKVHEWLFSQRLKK
ncbi:dienelactone hydrolase family protein [Verrucomicrobiales bacterium]|nr:dienelactone hydrolase family protein [Verrucomicrobiales bacterium]MDC0321727.1 dienelactone hydrolase family protein [Verrucomicrobiales bacterium]